MTVHPIRLQPINVWRAPEHQDSPSWIALFGDGSAFPIRFSGSTEDDVRGKAEAFRDDVIAKNEAVFQSRVAAIEKGRATRKAKGGA
jgi:hypothetical protein